MGITKTWLYIRLLNENTDFTQRFKSFSTITNNDLMRSIRDVPLINKLERSLLGSRQGEDENKTNIAHQKNEIFGNHK